jgi:hypothetical protein
MKLPNLSNNQMVILFAICLGLIIAAFFIFAAPVEAQEPPKDQGLTRADWHEIGSTLKPTRSTDTTTTRTTGYLDAPAYEPVTDQGLNSQYLDLETVTDSSGKSTTTGYLGNQYLEVETEKD